MELDGKLQLEGSSGSSTRDGAPPAKARAKKKPSALKINLTNCKYEILRILQKKLGWLDVSGAGEDGPWDVYWTDTSVSAERVMRLKPHQRLNHFHGMLDICRKRSMALHLQRMAALEPAHYGFFPTTFVLPGDMPALLADAAGAGRKQAYILKPDAGCQGKGIRLVQGGNEATLRAALQAMTSGATSTATGATTITATITTAAAASSPRGGQGSSAKVVAQHYLARPLLLGGYKFDLRVYALVAAVDPLRVYVHRQGLVRLCTSKYKKPRAGNLAVSFMHLTNYAVNRKNASFLANNQQQAPGGLQAAGGSGGAAAGGDSSKWYLSQLQACLEQRGHCWDKVWASIQQLVVKSLLPVQPQLQHHCRVLLGSAAGSSTPRAAAPAAAHSISAASSGASSSRGTPAACSGTTPGPVASCCFELLGFDVMLDAQLQPWLIEINHSPSFNIDSPLDRAVKEQVLGDVLAMVAPKASEAARARRSQRSEAEARLLGGLVRRGPAGVVQGERGGAAGRGGDTRWQGSRQGRRQEARQQELSAAAGRRATVDVGVVQRLAAPQQQEQQHDSGDALSTIQQESQADQQEQVQEQPDQQQQDQEQQQQQQQQQREGSEEQLEQPEEHEDDDEQDDVSSSTAETGTAAVAEQGSTTSSTTSIAPNKGKAAHLGGFDRVFPVHKQPELQATYEHLLAVSQGLFRAAGPSAAVSSPRGACKAPAAGSKQNLAVAGGAEGAASGAGMKAVRLLHNSYARPGSPDRRSLLSGRVTR